MPHVPPISASLILPFITVFKERVAKFTAKHLYRWSDSMLDSGSYWTWAVSFTPQQLIARERGLQYRLNTRLGGAPQPAWNEKVPLQNS
jgi:hypothetical protein